MTSPEKVFVPARKSYTTKQRVEIFERASGICCECGMKIHVNEIWHVGHIKTRALGSSTEDLNGIQNLAPAHAKCNLDRANNEEKPAIAKAERIWAKHIGATVKRGPAIPGSKRSGWRKKMDGTVVRRIK